MSRCHLPILASDDSERDKQVRAVVRPLVLTDGDIARLVETFEVETRQGLSGDPDERAMTSLQMGNTHVRRLLNGTENGDYLAMDLGGTNFRVLLCRMRNGVCESESRNYNVPKPRLTGPAAEVFDHLADSLHRFLSDKDLLEHHLPLGFTFSFPMKHDGLKSGILITWTKSFACPDGVGEDAVKMLEDAITRRGGMHVDVVAILNDTTGTLLAGSYLDHECAIGLIIGTGCNAAYIERLENMPKWTDPIEEPKQVIIDTQWGAFGDNGTVDFFKTEFDRAVDAHSHHTGSFTFDKMIGGHCIGDLVRLVLLRLRNDGLLFANIDVPALETWGTFTAANISDIERDAVGSSLQTRRVLSAWSASLRDVSASDVCVVQYVCGVVSLRSAQLVCAVISVLLSRLKRPRVTVGIDGSQYRHHPKLHDLMTDILTSLSPGVQCRLILAEDGSGRGAAFVAAVMARVSDDR